MEINENQPNENKQAVLFRACYMARESATVMCFFRRDSKAARGVGRFCSGEKGKALGEP